MSEALSSPSGSEVQPVVPRDDEGGNTLVDGIQGRPGDPDSGIEAPEKARVLAEASDEHWTLAANLEQSSIPGSADFARTLREKGDELAEQAKANYEQDKANYGKARDYIVGCIVALTKGNIDITDPLVIMGKRITTSLTGRWVPPSGDWVNVGDTTIRSSDAEELRDLVYQVLGAKEAPDEEAFRQEGFSSWWTAETPTKSGMNVSEMRHRDATHRGDYENEHEGLGTLLKLSLLRSDGRT